MKSFLTAANPGTDHFRKDQICKEHVNINKNIPVERKLKVYIHKEQQIFFLWYHIISKRNHRFT